MADFYEIDFLDVETDSSGDAITLRYVVNDVQTVHVVDGGYKVTGDSIVDHIAKYYGNPQQVDHAIVTHCDRDHTGGLKVVLEKMNVGTLWMLRPWLYAAELLPRFATYESADRLESKLRRVYANLAALEEIANRRGIPIRDPFQGATIGAFKVLAPSRATYLDLIVDSQRTPESVEEQEDTAVAKSVRFLAEMAKKVVNLAKAAWGEEVFSTDPVSAENEMSLIQYANLNGKKILLTGDAGRGALQEAINYAPAVGLNLPGLDIVQVPHHGSRRNVSTEILDALLGPRLERAPLAGEHTFNAYVSSAKADTRHPRKSVVRAFYHRGGRVTATESRTVRTSSPEAPARTGWSAVEAMPYPDTQEQD